ncbi:MAG TPA: hypothetical protein VK747_13300, partial [Blastocatellia bacterium]|nr:hypothetical protein [Blastocatellia bacterium]
MVVSYFCVARQENRQAAKNAKITEGTHRDLGVLGVLAVSHFAVKTISQRCPIYSPTLCREPDPCLAFPLVIETLRQKANRLHLRQAGSLPDSGIAAERSMKIKL